MSLLREYGRYLRRSFPTKDDRRREFKRQQWRKRVDAEMRATRKPVRPKDVFVAWIVLAAICGGFALYDQVYSSEHPANPVPKASPNPPPPNTPARLLSGQYITPADYRQMLKGHYIHNDPACVDGIDTGDAHAGDLCLPPGAPAGKSHPR